MSSLPQGELLVRQRLEEELVRDLEVGTATEDPPRGRFKWPERRHGTPRTRQRYLLTDFDSCEELGQMSLGLGNIDLNIHAIRISGARTLRLGRLFRRRLSVLCDVDHWEVGVWGRGAGRDGPGALPPRPMTTGVGP